MGGPAWRTMMNEQDGAIAACYCPASRLRESIADSHLATMARET